jgi:benzylsuccinate CoA-transferase BbsF subunit
MRLFEGVRVFEIGQAIAAPNIGRFLAHHGAEVFKIESPTSPDVVRMIGSAWLRDNDELASAMPDSSPYVSEMNADKKSVALDLKQPEGRAAANALVAECDIFLSNLGARALADLDLDYQSVRALNDDIVYLQLPGFGSDPEAPYYPYVAWGPNQAPLVGVDDLTGEADGDPAGIATVAPPDYLSALHGVFCAVVGLEERERTGLGVHVDISQFETTVALLLGPFLMDEALSGNAQSRIGNRSLDYAPEGVYPCKGDERWIAISVVDDEAWQAFLTLAPEGVATDERFATNAARLANVDALDELIAAWTASFDNGDLAARLQAAGVPAHIVATNEDILQDPHIMQSGFYQVRPSARFTRDLFSGYPLRFSDTPGSWERGGPSSGEHTEEVLTEVAGLTGEAVRDLVARGAAFTMTDPDLQLDRPYEDWLHILLPNDAVDARDL